jgi:hypothetical protein
MAACKTVVDLKARADAAWRNVTRQLQGMAPHMERADGPEEWTTREVLSHLLFEPGWRASDTLRTFATTNLPVIDIAVADTYLDDERRRWTLEQFVERLDAQRRDVFEYLETLPEPDLERKARIPLFKTFMGTEEITLPVYVGAMFDYHWNDHAGQLAKIRKAVGLPEAK